MSTVAQRLAGTADRAERPSRGGTDSGASRSAAVAIGAGGWAAAPHVLPVGGVRAVEPRGRALRVRCEEGAIWVTQEGDGRDVILCAGQEHFLLPRGKVVIQGLLPALYALNPA